MNEVMNRIMLAMGEGNVSGAAANVGRHQSQQIRFWIITMMLVLFGLSTLKLR